MKKFIFALVLIILWSLFCAFSGYIAAKKTIDPVIIQGETVWRDKVVYRDYTIMTVAEKDKALECYDASEFFLSFEPIKNNEYRITGNLCGREAHKDIEIECGQSSNWKFYLGLGSAVAIGTGIYLGLK